MTTTAPAIGRAMTNFAKSRTDARSPATLRNYRIALEALLSYLRDEEDLAPEDGTVHLRADLPAAFYTSLRMRGLAAGTAILYAGIARSFCFELCLLGQAPQIDPLVMRDLLRRRLPRQNTEGVCPDEQIPAVAAYYERVALPKAGGAALRLLRDRALLATLYGTAGRISEVRSITRAAVQGGQDELSVTGKGNRTRTLYLTAGARAAIAAYLALRTDQSPYLFVSHGRTAQQEAPLTPQQLWNVVRTAAEAVGAPGVHPHSFRHWRASAWLSGGLPLELVQDLLGHRDITTTRRVYARYLGSTVRDRFFAFEDQAG